MSQSSNDEFEKTSQHGVEYSGHHIAVIKNVGELGDHYSNQSYELY